jgi:Polyketide cyclase / dehydrase and lipid transport
VFVDEWDVDAPQEAVFDAVADARTYPDWWVPVYESVTGDENVTQHRFKGRLPYTLDMRAEMVSKDPPNRFEVEVDGDLRGKGVWTFTPREGKTHVRWDWIVFADRPLLRYLTPVLRPLFRWNHNWAVARAREGLEPYARTHAKSGISGSGGLDRAEGPP